MIENDKVMIHWGEENAYSQPQHCIKEEMNFLLELFLSQSKNVNGTELETF